MLYTFIYQFPKKIDQKIPTEDIAAVFEEILGTDLNDKNGA